MAATQFFFYSYVLCYSNVYYNKLYNNLYISVIRVVTNLPRQKAIYYQQNNLQTRLLNIRAPGGPSNRFERSEWRYSFEAHTDMTSGPSLRQSGIHN